MTEWISVAPALLVTFGMLLFPGLVVLVAGWRVSIRLLLLSPAVSLTLVAVAAIIAPLIGMAWSLAPLSLVTLVVAAAAFGLRFMAPPRSKERDGRRVVVASVLGLAVGAAILSVQLMHAFITPENISQTFDAIVHLNSVATATEQGNASALAIGLPSGSPFYPNAWAALASLTAITTGVSVPAAVNVATIAIAALVWPASSMVFAWSLFAARPTAMIATGILSAAFGAFPWITLYFGVLYPNMTGYAMIPALIGEGLRVGRVARGRRLIPDILLLLVLMLGVALAHPNALVGAIYIGVALALYHIGRQLLRHPSRRRALTLAVVGVAVVLVIPLIRPYVGTSEGASGWGPWQSPAQAFGEAILAHPDHLRVTLPLAALIVAGIVTAILLPRYLEVLVPFGVGVVLFIAASGYPIGTRVREFLTNPWYNDSFRLAALLGVVALPVAVLGVVGLVQFARRLAPDRPPKWAVAVVAGAGVLALIAVAVAGAGVRHAIDRTRATFAFTDDAYLLSTDEHALLLELDQLTPPDALIAGSPRTGASLALAVAGRAVTDVHIFGPRTDAEHYIDAYLRNIDDDPRVCEAVRATGVDYVLDFGDDGVGNVYVDAWDGVSDLEPGAHLTLVAQVGDAKLFEIEGC